MSKRQLEIEDFDEKSWVSAGKTANWMRNDPLLDYLSMYCSESPSMIPNIIMGDTVKKINEEKVVVPKTHEHAFILEQGNQFEIAVLARIKKKFPKNVIQVAFNKKDIILDSKAKETIEHMKNGVPFIYQGVLQDWDTQTFGSPDFMVRSDYLHKLVKVNPLTKDEYTVPADFSETKSIEQPLELGEPIDSFTKRKRSKKSSSRNVNKWHYVIVDVKYSTLKLRTDGIHLTNGGNMAAYKAQMYIYHRALSTIQGVEPKNAYLLGRNWNYVKNNVKVRGNGPFERLGSINFTNPKLDKHIIEKSNEAVAWIRRVRNEGMFWSISPKPSIYELYPNMSNKYDSPWHWKKKEMASQLDEITSVWYCGVKQRKRAHDDGITAWTDPKLTPEIMGFKKRKTEAEDPKLGDIIGEILAINRQEDELVLPKSIKNNYRNWQSLASDGVTDKPVELYVDFETVHSAAASTAESNVNSTVGSTFGSKRKQSGDLIFMVGVGWFEEGMWRYRNFTATHMTFDAERKILNDFHTCVKGVFDRDMERRETIEPNFWQRIKRKMSNMARLFRRGEASLQEVRDSQLHMNIYHWGHIEQHAFARAMDRHPRQKFTDELICNNWVNFYDIMRKEPIVVKGSLSFGLKAIVSGMHKNGLIETTYDDQDCANGIQAMADAIEIYNSGVNVLKSKKMISVMEYNEVDCKAVFEIIEYLRNNNGKDRIVERGDVVYEESSELSEEPSELSEEPAYSKKKLSRKRLRSQIEESEEPESESASVELFE